MNIHFKRSTIVKNSSGFSYSFYLNDSGSIDYDSFNQSHELINTNNLVDSDILEFSVSIDRFDTIHLIALNSIGELIYFTCKNKMWSKNVINVLDLNSNNYKHFNLLVFDDSIGFLWSYSNLINSSVWNVEYVSIKPTFEKKNIISLLTGGSFSPYSFAIDKFNDIHLLYRATENRCSQIYYISFSPFLNIYKKPPIKISSDRVNSFHPYIFIDSRSQIHALWTNKSSINSSNFEYMIMFENESKFNSLNTPTTKHNVSFPIMIEEDNMLKIIYCFDNALGLISSEDHGLSWVQSNPIDIQKNNLYLTKYSSNYLSDNNNYNIDYSYTNIDRNISMVFCDIFKNCLFPLEEELSDEPYIDFSSNLDVNSMNSEYIDDFIVKVQDYISKNLIKVDSNLIVDNNYSEAIKKVEVKLTEHKDKNNDLVELLNSLKGYYEKSSSTIEKLENDLDYLKENLENQNNSFLKSLFSKFK